MTDYSRPFPPASVTSLTNKDDFEPAPDVAEWIRSAFLDESGPLYYKGHDHLRQASIGVLWTNQPYRRRGRPVAGMAEQAGNVGGMSRWKSGRITLQLERWFGHVPDFLITLDAIQAQSMPDLVFCALVDHELCHCGQRLDEFGMLKFDRDTGKPLFTIRGHDVEEFVSVVERFGIEAAGDSAVDLVIAAGNKPKIGPARVGIACGTCELRVA